MAELSNLYSTTLQSNTAINRYELHYMLQLKKTINGYEHYKLQPKTAINRYELYYMLIYMNFIIG